MEEKMRIQKLTMEKYKRYGNLYSECNSEDYERNRSIISEKMKTLYDIEKQINSVLGINTSLEDEEIEKLKRKKKK
mgnify:CR=1 FL=1